MQAPTSYDLLVKSCLFMVPDVDLPQNPELATTCLHQWTLEILFLLSRADRMR